MQLYTLLMLLAIFSGATGLKCLACRGDYSCWTVGCASKRRSLRDCDGGWCHWLHSQ
ncbi:unnamed protein product [Tetraodon nigroviridis]|uniref:(spotted green pufferfish) hypothetical protein n=1 Tax=Tetraodon nigroviridis TaxID=99883 RepID=Q4RUX8_TETNG|nr:unnamed protein product [Tetraodon nigroviridis]